MEHGFGGTATVLVKRGTLRKGAFLVCGTSFAKVKLLLDTSAALEKGKFWATREKRKMEIDKK